MPGQGETIWKHWLVVVSAFHTLEVKLYKCFSWSLQLNEYIYYIKTTTTTTKQQLNCQYAANAQTCVCMCSYVIYIYQSCVCVCVCGPELGE